MTGTLFRIDPALPLCWEGPDTLRVGFDRPFSSIPQPSAGMQRVVGAFRAGLPLAPDQRRLRRYGVTAAEWRRVVELLSPVLVEAPPVDAPRSHACDSALRIALSGSGVAHDRIAEALARAGHRVDEPAPTGSPRTAPEPDLLVVVERFIGSPGPDLLLLAERVPRLTLRFGDRGFWLGPLTEPAGSPCARCAAEHEIDADPALPLVAAQLLGLVPAAETVFAAAAASQLALAAIRRWRHGDTALARSRIRVAVVSGLPEPLAIPEPVTPHPGCPCLAGARDPAQAVTAIPASARNREGVR
ncbi:MAG: hypothetical protein D3X82_05420 [Candidatus Leucobacter sulfamidivorax]|nr:hypothetical protein [Candidatus Leucobacter sulfamidivorax]